MIEIDRSDRLYKYLSALGVSNIDSEYLKLAENGRYSRADVQKYYYSTFSPSLTKEIDEAELEKVLDYYVEIKKLHSVRGADLKKLLVEYKNSPTNELKERIINSQLKDVLHLCLNYKSMHEDADIQDLVQTASLALLEALEKYNEKAGVDFKDYIIYYIRKSLIKDYEEEKDA